MNTHSLLPLAALLLAGPAQVCAIELGRQDLTAPGAMISTCGGLGQGGSVGDLSLIHISEPTRPY